MVYYRFTDSSTAEKSFSDLNGTKYTPDFEIQKLVANRVATNQQYLNLNFSDDLDLIQVLSHKLFHYESEE